MRLLTAGLAVTFLLASVTAFLLLWSVFLDAPWEDESPPAVEEQSDMELLRCEAALSLKETILGQGRYDSGGNRDGVRNYSSELGSAERDIKRYCY